MACVDSIATLGYGAFEGLTHLNALKFAKLAKVVKLTVKQPQPQISRMEEE